MSEPSERAPHFPSREQLEAGYSAVHNQLAYLEGLGTLRHALDMARQAAAAMEDVQQNIARLQAEMQRKEDEAQATQAAYAEQQAILEAEQQMQRDAWDHERHILEDQMQQARQAVRVAQRHAHAEIQAQTQRIKQERDKLQGEIQGELDQWRAQVTDLRHDVEVLAAQKAQLEADMAALVRRVTVAEPL